MVLGNRNYSGFPPFRFPAELGRGRVKAMIAFLFPGKSRQLARDWRTKAWRAMLSFFLLDAALIFLRLPCHFMLTVFHFMHLKFVR